MVRLFVICFTLMAASVVNCAEVDAVRQLQENYEILMGKFHQLETKFKAQESILKSLESDRQSAIAKVDAESENPPPGQRAFPRTCRAALAANPSLPSGLYWIDPDGSASGDDAIRVHCNMTTGSTEILHDSELPMDPGHCASPGCYSRPIHYKASSRQIAALTELSVECWQSIKYDCVASPLELNGISYAWWNDRNGNPQYFWSGSNSRVHICQCGIDQTCFENDVRCNCDSDANLPLADHGVITRKKLLPVTRLNYGRTIFVNSSGLHTLGRLECDGRLAVNKGLPTSCADLWRNGLASSGMYSIKGEKQVEKVYCDLNKLPSDPDFQTWIGYEDVKSQPVYFYVQKNLDFSSLNTPITFENELLNVGNAMNISSGIFTAPRSGRYFFTLSGIKDGAATGIYISLRLNGAHAGQAYGSYGGVYYTYSMQTTLNMQVGDQVSLVVTDGALHDNSITSYFTNFSGWLLEEDVFH